MMRDSSRDKSPRLGGRGHIDGREPALTGDRALLHALEMLKAADEQTRLDAAFALARLGDERAAGHLVAILQGEQPVEVRRRAALALGPVGMAALPMLLPLLAEPEPPAALLKLALGAVVEHFPEAKATFTTALIAIAEGGDRVTYGRAVTLMGVIGDEALLPWLVRAVRGEHAIPFVVAEAITSLGEMGGLARRQEVVDALFDWLRVMRQGPSESWFRVTRALVSIGDPSTLPRALQVMQDPESKLGTALYSLVDGDLRAGAAPHLLKAMSDPHQAHNQRAIITALGCTDDERAVDFLLEKLEMPSDLTETIIEALARLKRKRTIPMLVRVLKSAYRPSVAAQCLAALSTLDDPSVLPDMLPFMTESRIAGGMVFNMVERFRYEPAVPALVETLSDSMLRTMAIRALVTIGTETAYQALAEHCDHHMLRNARPWARRELWQAYYRWRRAAERTALRAEG